MIESNNNLQNARQRAQLHATLRLVIALLFLAVMFCSVSGLEGNDYDLQTGLNAFLFCFLPTVSILLLLPVLIRGSLGEKILAAVVLLPAAWFAFMGWAAVISGLTR
jgi:hypothetical protein